MCCSDETYSKDQLEIHTEPKTQSITEPQRDISEIQNRKICPSLCLFYFANNQNYVTRE